MALSADMLYQPGKYTVQELQAGIKVLEVFLAHYNQIQLILQTSHIDATILEAHIKTLQETAAIVEVRDKKV